MRETNSKDDADRAGRYVRQPRGYSAFIPEPLPPVLTITDALTEARDRANLALGRLDSAVETLPHPELFTAMYVRREAVLSSQIEGTQASLDDLVAVEARLRGDQPLGDVNEVLNYTAALRHGLERLQTLPISGRLLREIHAILMRGVRGGHATPGEYRTTQNWIGAAGAGLQNAIFVPPPPEDVAEHVGNLERFLHGDSRLSVIVQIGLAHAQFETIHPFVDGNGRLGRLLITFLLCERKVLSKPVLYVSLTLKKRRQEYYERLQAVRDRGAWEAWLVFFLDCVTEAALDAANLARQILRLREDHRDRVVDAMGARAGKALKVLERLYRDPYMDVNQATALLQVSYANANDIIADMERLGLLREATGNQRNRVFVYEPYLALFREI
ncbi:MAG TPA: Fic family protein [Brevundimonas sp.]|jgi:Fic family protein|uniref:Fic family protein n=1 Tax=Brevundimonas sp. TaxID=1871086 RepID=UPI002BF81185|nr:Fic family protein [Brevundimonas sp.]HRH20586.1 Fic family protein [Brevundimonas sp.]